MSEQELVVDFDILEEQAQHMRYTLAEMRAQREEIPDDVSGYSDDPALQEVMNNLGLLIGADTGSIKERFMLLEERIEWAESQMRALIELFRDEESKSAYLMERLGQ